VPDLAALKQRLLLLRARRPWLDHTLRAYDHYTTSRGNHLAGAVTYFGFLSLFPLLAVSFALLGWVVVVWPEAEGEVGEFLSANLPGLVGSEPGKLNPESIAGAKAGAGLVGLAGLIYAGLGWLQALREALRQVYGLPPSETNMVVRKLIDLALIAMLGLCLLVTLASSSLATTLTRQVLELVGLEEQRLAVALLKILAVGLSVLGDMLLLAVIFARLPGTRLPWRYIRSGALLGAVLLSALKLIGTWLIARTTGNVVYGTFAVVVGLLVWLNFLSRAVLLAAAWAVTGAHPVVAPTLTAEPSVHIPVLDADRIAAGPQSGRRSRVASALGVVGLVALRRRRT